jgi:hypothetical protein
MSHIEDDLVYRSNADLPMWLNGVHTADELRASIISRYEKICPLLGFKAQQLVIADDLSSRDPYDYGHEGEGRYRAARLEKSQIIYWFWRYNTGDIAIESTELMGKFTKKSVDSQIKTSLVLALLVDPNNQYNLTRARNVGWDIEVFKKVYPDGS